MQSASESDQLPSTALILRARKGSIESGTLQTAELQLGASKQADLGTTLVCPDGATQSVHRWAGSQKVASRFPLLRRFSTHSLTLTTHDAPISAVATFQLHSGVCKVAGVKHPAMPKVLIK